MKFGWIIIRLLLWLLSLAGEARGCGAAIATSVPTLNASGWVVLNEAGVMSMFDVGAEELTIRYQGRVIFEGKIATRRILEKTGFANSREWFMALAREIRVGAEIENVDHFQIDSRARHFSRHGRDTGTGSEEKYEESAFQLAHSTALTTLSLRSRLNRIKMDLESLKMVVTHHRSGILITHYRIDEERKRDDGFVGAVDCFFANLEPAE